jgi:putative ABC transport system ATP-binding protein
MVTHSMKQALEVGERTIMLHQGRIILDIDGEKRKDMGVKDLLDMFEQKQGESLSDDSALG